jgi:hypothetical protein
MPVAWREPKDSAVVVLGDSRARRRGRWRWRGCSGGNGGCHDGRAHGRRRRHQRSQSDLDCFRCAPPMGSAR